LSHACLRIMGASLHFNMCSLPSSYSFDSEVQDMKQTVQKNILDIPGLEYACRYWTSHLVKEPTDSGDSRLLDALWEFGQEKVLFWFEVMNLLAARRECHDGANAVKKWIDMAPDTTTGLKATFAAASRLSMSFLQTAACQSTPHLYISSLAVEFATNPNISNQWKNRFPGIPQLRCAGVSNHGGILTRIDVGSSVNAVAFSPDGTRVVSSSDDHSVRIWDASTGQQVQMLGGHTSWVMSVAFSPDGTRVVSGSDDHSVRIWDASTGQQVQMLDGHTESVTSVAFSPDGTRVVSGLSDNSVRIWDASTGQQVQMLDGHTSWVTSVAFSPDGTRVVSGLSDNLVWIWDASTGQQVQMLDGHTESVTSVAFSPDGTHVVSGLYNNSVRIWN
ncbi:quinon protein alcohol dehydrogenase-like superfamily, partial [Vararia minispora EC-137]